MTPIDFPDASTEPRDILQRGVTFARRTLRFWYVPLGAALVGGLGALGVFQFVVPAYRSEIVILSTEGMRPVDPNEQSSAPRSVAARIQEILTSRAQLGRAVEEFDLYPEIRSKLGPVDAVDELRKHVQFKALGGDTFKIAFEGSSPDQAQRVTSRLAELMLDEDLGLRKTQARVTQEFLTAEKKGTETRLREAEHELASFMAEHPRFAIDTTPLMTGAAVRASQPASPPPTRGGYAPRVAAPAGQVGESAPGDGQARRPSVEKAAAQATLAAAQANLSEKLTHFLPAHPDVKAAQGAVEAAEAQLAAASEAAAVRAPPEGAPVIAPAASALHASPPRYVAASAPAPSAKGGEDLVALETEWDKLTRGVIEARQRHDQVEVALFKADIAASSETGGSGLRMTVIDPAYLPQRPVPPGRLTLAAAVMGLALALGLLIAVACAALDDRIYGQRDLRRFTVVLAEVPRVRVQRRAHAAR